MNTDNINSTTYDIDLVGPTQSGYVRLPCIPDTQDTWSGSPPPTGFVHGTSHTASFQITISPANQSCQLELWLGPNSTTKSASGGLSAAFNSTGAALQVTSTVTLPAAGTYNVYVDIYLSGVKVVTFVGLSTVTVT